MIYEFKYFSELDKVYVDFANFFNQYWALTPRYYNIFQVFLTLGGYYKDQEKAVPATLDYAFTFWDISNIIFLRPLKSVLEIEKPKFFWKNYGHYFVCSLAKYTPILLELSTAFFSETSCKKQLHKILLECI